MHLSAHLEGRGFGLLLRLRLWEDFDFCFLEEKADGVELDIEASWACDEEGAVVNSDEWGTRPVPESKAKLVPVCPKFEIAFDTCESDVEFELYASSWRREAYCAMDAGATVRCAPSSSPKFTPAPEVRIGVSSSSDASPPSVSPAKRSSWRVESTRVVRRCWMC